MTDPLRWVCLDLRSEQFYALSSRACWAAWHCGRRYPTSRIVYCWNSTLETTSTDLIWRPSLSIFPALLQWQENLEQQNSLMFRIFPSFRKIIPKNNVMIIQLTKIWPPNNVTTLDEKKQYTENNRKQWWYWIQGWKSTFSNAYSTEVVNWKSPMSIKSWE